MKTNKVLEVFDRQHPILKTAIIVIGLFAVGIAGVELLNAIFS